MSAISQDYVHDWAERLRSRIYTQFRGTISWEKWVLFLAQQFQDLEDATQSLFSVYDIDNSEGVQLDVIGSLIGQPRVGLDDATYRLFLKARIQANRSSGGPEDLYAVFRALYGAAIGLVVSTSPIKTVVLRVKGVITPLLAGYGVGFLRDSKEAGARAILEWQEAEDDDMFAFEGGPGLGFDDGSATVGGKLAMAK